MNQRTKTVMFFRNEDKQALSDLRGKDDDVKSAESRERIANTYAAERWIILSLSLDAAERWVIEAKKSKIMRSASVVMLLSQKRTLS